MQPVVECIPNFSEGYRIEVIDAIVNAIQSVRGVEVLHRTSDADHNRSVVTFIGSPDAVVEGAFQAVKVASQQINMEHHQGVHPRLGAADVVPLVPLKDIAMQECVALSHQLGQKIGKDLQLPVYLYEESATRPERRLLADVRRGQYEQLKHTIHLPERQPDYGLAQVGQAGAVIVGARKPLIAYNVFLTSGDVHLARDIAKQIRETNGGYKGVRALGLLVRGQAQISMNFVDYHTTPVHVVFDRIGQLAREHGVAIERSELIGLLPQDAIEQAVNHYMRLPDFDFERVLDLRVQRFVNSNHLSG